MHTPYAIAYAELKQRYKIIPERPNKEALKRHKKENGPGTFEDWL